MLTRERKGECKDKNRERKKDEYFSRNEKKIEYINWEKEFSKKTGNVSSLFISN